MAALYANENFPLCVVQALRDHGHDVQTTLEAGEAGRAVPDEQVLAYAAARNRAVVTLNRRDFIRLHQQSAAHAGVIVCSVDADPDALARHIHDAITRQGSIAGQLLRVTREG
jgi:hypothetical protein